MIPLTVGKSGTLAEYVAFVDDAPLEGLIFNSTDGYSYSSPPPGTSPAAISAVIRAMVLKVGDPYVMALGRSGNGLYSGNWRHADLYTGANLKEEIGENDPASMIGNGWGYNTADGQPFHIGGQIESQTGGSVGQILQGLDDRTDNNHAPADDPRRVIIIPIVDFTASLSGTTSWTINSFAAFRITDYGKQEDIIGEFIEWVAPGSWQDAPPGPLYVKTVVLTE